MKKLLLLLFAISFWGTNAATAQNNCRFGTAKISDIHPTGWLKTLLQRQHDGLTGHPEALSYPYNSCLWAGEISRSDETYGDNWWRYEQTAYYTDGLLRLGYELEDEAMVAKAMEGIEYTLAHPDENGVLGNSTLVGITWPMSVFFRVLQAKYEHDGDSRIVPALERHYLNFTPDELAGGIVGGRNIISLEGILWTYGKTGNRQLLQLAEDAWAIQDRFAVDETAILSSEPFYMHSVTFCEMVKLPLLLYAYTGKQHYLDLAMTAIRKVERESMLPDGVPSSAEFLLGDDIHISHETCDVVDFTWTLSHYLTVTGAAEWADKIEKAIYNAGLGAITKDFRSLQYFSSVNQFIATGTSNHNIYKHGSTWMAYRPTHETECCSGNVNRMLPNFVSRMWMTDADGGAVAALYGPSQATFTTEKGDLTITCQTNYPFSETLTFTVSGTEGATIPLTLRIPTWCSHASLIINDSPLDLYLQAGTFAKVSEAVKAGDVITLTLPMEVEKTSLVGQGVYFHRGPLLFSYAIPEKKEEDLTEYECMHGKKPENPDFKCWNITPTGAFNYAYADNGQPVQCVATEPQASSAFPFDRNDTPIHLIIPVKQIVWDLEDERYTPAQPEQGHLNILSDQTQYINLIPYGCTELRLTVFPDADAQPLPMPAEPDYSRPADAPDCVDVVTDVDYVYFEEPRFCWDEPIYCKVRTTNDTTTDLHSPQGGDLCEMVGTTANGRKIWRWTGTSTPERQPVELVFTNHDLVTVIMPFVLGGYYNYNALQYLTDIPTAIAARTAVVPQGTILFDLAGRRIAVPATTNRSVLPKGIYIENGKQLIIK
ncbi:MAG: glycoside hydrolase family 127 protein [Bacteroidaceae bacterium]|nr:glycoside hydrolase family 127 protein [Bacteroidaceae bacterium]